MTSCSRSGNFLVLPKFQSEYTLHAPVTIDEAMIPFKGPLSFKQYIKNKPVKWGIKAFVLSDATNGYVYKMQVYTGKGMETTEPEVELCSRVVLDLMSGLERHGLDLYTDDYYTSPELYLELYKRCQRVWYSTNKQARLSQGASTQKQDWKRGASMTIDQRDPY